MPRMTDPGNAQVNDPRSCSVCGAVAAPDDVGAALAWSTSVEGSRRRDVCPACTRTNVRSIEGKLPEEWW
jgi:hypothetical protein